MALTPGTRLGPYEIGALLGAGGMGEVYKAIDTNLKRPVAIKVLPASVATDAERLARLQREAEVLASLNHPHIAAIYGLERSGATTALVMELVEGPTLADRLARGAIALDEALPIAKQIAEALEAAHEQQIVHRDLKPANIKVRPDGTVKVLDFGLAKAFDPAPASDQSQSPTITSPAMTGMGIIMGTAAYMSPEQAKGKSVDKRSDIWAFGVVLFEMLTSQRAFEGETISDVLAKVIERERDWTALPASTPPRLRELLRRCGKKDPKTRLQAIGDARVQLDELISGTTEETATAIASRPSAERRARFAWIVAALSLVIAATLAVAATLALRRVVPELLPTRFEIPTPSTSDPVSFALSADGRQLAFVATFEGAPRLWVRPLEQVTAQPLPGTQGASYPFWAPDGRAIGFFADGKLKRIDVAGGVPQVLADAPSGRGGAWNREGVLVFAPDARQHLMRVMATGGTAVALTRFGPGQGSHRWPQFLPDGRRFLFLVAYGRPDTQGVYVGTLEGGEPTRVLAAETAAVYAPPGALLWVRQGVLVALRFDAARELVSGEPIPVAQAVGLDVGVLRGTFAVSTTGVLAHRTSEAERRQLVWVDRTGTVRGAVGPPDENGLSSPELAPDGRRVAVFRTVQRNTNVWLIEVGRGVASRFTFGGNDGFPLWSPDGRRVVFASETNGVFDLFEKAVSGPGDEQPLLATSDNKNPLAWSPDGRVLLFAIQHPKTGTDLWALPLQALRPSTSLGQPERVEGQQAQEVLSQSRDERKPFPVLQTPFDEAAGQLSPNGRWLAYQSNESGQVQIYVQPFPGLGDKWQVSTAGGSQPRWRRDGKELFYVAPDGRLMAVSLAVGADRQTLEAGAPVPLFATRLATGSNIPGGWTSKPQYAVASDGHFLMNVAVEGATAPPITVVLNWQEELKQRVPTR